MPERVGFVGLGIMGKPMATNLMDAGYKLTVHNRSPEKANELGEAGASVANSPKEVAENADIIITMLPGPPEVQEIVASEDGLVHNIREG
jgi:2-hydroxy-3-oxopropionate reductase